MNKDADRRGIYRAIYTALWDDTDFQKLNSDCKLVLLNLRTGPLTNMPCLYRYYLEAMERQTGLPRYRIQKALDTLCDTLWVRVENGLVWVKNALKYDPQIYLNNEKHLKAIKNIISGLPKLKIVIDFCTYYNIDIPYEIPHDIGYDIPHPIPYGIHPDPEKDKEKEKDIGKNTLSHTLSDFLESLKQNPAYSHINLDNELSKMDAWLLLPKNKGRKKTSRFILNWINKIEKPFQISQPQIKEASPPEWIKEAIKEGWKDG